MRMRREIRGPFGQDCLGAALLLIVVAVLAGCGQPPVPPPVVSETCPVTAEEIRQWIENPSMPLEPAGSADDCFYNFAWQELFAVTRPEGGVPRFATWPSDQELFPASGDPEPWRAGPRLIRGRQIRKGRGRPGGVIADQFKEAAALTPLTDQNWRWVHYSVVVNQPEYDYIRCCQLYQGGCFNSRGCDIALPHGSVELKLAWRVLETCGLPDSKSPCTKEDTSRYLTVRGEVELTPGQKFPAILGLVGMHIIHWTEQYPDAVWATFEHIDNAPDCPPSGPDGPIQEPPSGFPGWAFYNANCDPATPYCQENQYCLPCPVKVPPDVVTAFNQNQNKQKPPGWNIPADGVITCTPAPSEFNQPVQMPDGTEVWIYLFDPQCTKPPIPTQTCRSIPIRPDVKTLNNQVQEVLAGFSPGLPAVLANYELVGAEWFDHRQFQLQPQKTVLLANTTMETYLQTLPLGCVTCHSNQAMVGSVNPVPNQSPMQFNSGLADRSFVFQQIRQFGTACKPEAPPSCGAWKDLCKRCKRSQATQ